jgi:hypothetical protein
MDFLEARGENIYRGDEPVLLRGFGLGGWLLPEGYMWKFDAPCDRPRRFEKLLLDLCGAAYAGSFWAGYYETYITEADIRLIAERGFNSVRLPLNARHLLENNRGVLRLQEETLALVDRLVGWCRKCGVYVILDMHAAPGGQTGQNIDDSEGDKPELFMDGRYQTELVELWRLLAEHYRDEPAVGGYDLLNEPLPEWNKSYYPLVVPLYERIIRAVRTVDTRHCIILEGVHWATDFSIFDVWDQAADKNLVLQFHKYWSSPDQESLAAYLRYREKFALPLFMGEGGENTCAWYTGAFPLYERLNISWNFWSYKKMDTKNSPLSIDPPPDWQILTDYLQGGPPPSRDRAISVFDDFLNRLKSPRIIEEVFRALKREVPIDIPAEFYDDAQAAGPRQPGASFRTGDTITIVFADGHTGRPDYPQGGAVPPEKEKLLVRLSPGDWAAYRFRMPRAGDLRIRLDAAGPGRLALDCSGGSAETGLGKTGNPAPAVFALGEGEHHLRIACLEGTVLLDEVRLSFGS